MTSRISSGSSRADSSVEPTRSQNSTVSWRRSASALFLSSRTRFGLLGAGAASPPRSSAIAFSNLCAVAENDPELLQISVGQLGQDFGVDRVLSKRRFVALESQLVQPSRDIHDVHRLQCGASLAD